MINASCLLHQIFQNIADKKCHITPLHATWEDYEKEKGIIVNLDLSATDYQNAIRKKADTLNL